MGEINTIRKRLLEIIERVKEINHEIDVIQQTNGVDFSSDEVKDILQQFRLIFSKSEDSEYSKA